MRKRGKYKPKRQLVNPLHHVLMGMLPLRNVGQEVLDLKLKAHGALARLTKGEGKEDDLVLVMQAMNMAEGLLYQGIGKEYRAELRAGQTAVVEIATRSVALKGRYVLKGDEMQALTVALDLHDAQLDICTVGEIEEAIRIVNDAARHKRTEHVPRYKEEER